MASVEELERTVDHLVRAVQMQSQALALMLEKIVEVAAHTNEHHEVINDLGRIVATLEEMMIGGLDETPDAPPAP